MSILVDSSDTFSISVVVGMISDTPKKYVACLEGDDAEKKWPEETQRFTHQFTFRPIDFKTNAIIVDNSVSFSNGAMAVNTASLRFQRIVNTLVEWTLLDTEGKMVLISEETVGMLPPAVASVLGDELDEMVS